MIRKLDRDQLAAEIATLEVLLGSMPADDLVGRLGLEVRRDELRERFAALQEAKEKRAKVALYFGGAPVAGSAGIEAGFGSAALSNFQDLLSKVWGALESGTLASMGPIKDKAASQLHITNLVHGSFGFLLEEIDEEGEPLFETELSKAADAVADYIAKFADEDDNRFTELIEEINPRVFDSLRGFFGQVYRAKATLRLVEGEHDDRFGREAVERAWHRAEEAGLEDDRVQVFGRLLGIIPVGRRFEMDPDGAPQIIAGKVGERFSQNYLERMSNEQFAGRRWKALLSRRVITKIGRAPIEKYTLLELEEIEG